MTSEHARDTPRTQYPSTQSLSPFRGRQRPELAELGAAPPVRASSGPSTLRRQHETSRVAVGAKPEPDQSERAARTMRAVVDNRLHAELDGCRHGRYRQLAGGSWRSRGKARRSVGAHRLRDPQREGPGAQPPCPQTAMSPSASAPCVPSTPNICCKIRTIRYIICANEHPKIPDYEGHRCSGQSDSSFGSGNDSIHSCASLPGAL